VAVILSVRRAKDICLKESMVMSMIEKLRLDLYCLFKPDSWSTGAVQCGGKKEERETDRTKCSGHEQWNEQHQEWSRQRSSPGRRHLVVSFRHQRGENVLLVLFHQLHITLGRWAATPPLHSSPEKPKNAIEKLPRKDVLLFPQV